MTSFIISITLLLLAGALMTVGTIAQWDNNFLSYLSGAMFLIGIAVYVYDLFKNGRKDSL